MYSMMELGHKRPSLLWFWRPTSITVVYMDPHGKGALYYGFLLTVI